MHLVSYAMTVAQSTSSTRSQRPFPNSASSQRPLRLRVIRSFAPLSCAETQKWPPVSPLPATLTHSLSRKSFPCHSYANTRDVCPSLPRFLSILVTRHSPRQSLNTFRINICKTVSKQRTSSPFRINTCEKPGGGGGRSLLFHVNINTRESGYPFIARLTNPHYTRESWPEWCHD